MSTRPTAAGFWAALLVVLFAALTLGGLVVWDQPVLEAVRAGQGNDLRRVARLLSYYGDFYWLLGGGAVLLVVCLLARRRRWLPLLVAMLLASILAGLVSNVTKLAAGRVRPRVENVAHGWYGPTHEGNWVSLRHDFQGFPSSHAACAFGFFFPLFLSRRLLGSAGLLVAASIAWSRVQLNAHHVSDVAAGSLIGVLAGWIVWRWIAERGGLARWLGDEQK